MPAYLIADDTITDTETFDEYKRQVLPLIERFGGRFLSRGGEVRVLESGKSWWPDRLVIIEFPTMSALEDWYQCPEYLAVRDIRLKSAESTLIALSEGSVT
ncbi:MAG: DUF1330 domain-containing protein [Alphaproteobacteria bacterium]|nr:MAG: DUF1330 domain-containing protein [Alphaproteobacteria bacterium]